MDKKRENNSTHAETKFRLDEMVSGAVRFLFDLYSFFYYINKYNKD